MIIKSMSWQQLKDGILSDELPRDKTKYVRYTNLADIIVSIALDILVLCSPF